jgi:protoporphyrinogen/coproporphyrinogen III oxidase
VGTPSGDADVIVIGGGIAGLAAALRLKDRGLEPLVLEAESRVGGRMTSDRIDGFVIDRAVSFLGKRFQRMRALVKRLELGGSVCDDENTVALVEEDGVRKFRAHRPDDLVRDKYLSVTAKLASLRFVWDVTRNHWNLAHGRSDRALQLDQQSSAEYFKGLGRGGEELFARLFEPTMRSPLGGAAAPVSELALMQVVRNTLGGGLWNLTGGVDQIPEAIARHVRVLTSARVQRVNYSKNAAEVETIISENSQRFSARGVIFALPGCTVPGLCSQLPDWIVGPLRDLNYARMASAHVGLAQTPHASCASYTFATERGDGIQALSLEHLRGTGRCPAGKGLISAYFGERPNFSCTLASDAELQGRASKLIEQQFPECANKISFIHLVRWTTGIAFFPPGQVTRMVEIRKRLPQWEMSVDFCGDYMDGIASEAALRTGEQAAERLADKMAAP